MSSGAGEPAGEERGVPSMSPFRCEGRPRARFGVGAASGVGSTRVAGAEGAMTAEGMAWLTYEMTAICALDSGSFG